MEEPEPAQLNKQKRQPVGKGSGSEVDRTRHIPQSHRGLLCFPVVTTKCPMQKSETFQGSLPSPPRQREPAGTSFRGTARSFVGQRAGLAW